MDNVRGWLRRITGHDATPEEDQDRLSTLPFIQRQNHDLRRSSSQGGSNSEDDGGTGFNFSNFLQRLPRPSVRLLKLTDPDKGEEEALRHRGSLWTPDRGPGFYQTQRARSNAPHLVTTGRHAGRSRVVYEGIERRQLAYHIWKRDFFTSCINLPLPYAIGLALLLYTASFFFWATIWWCIWKTHPDCVSDFEGYVSAFVFAVATQQTIGYGDVSPNNCWLANFVITIQSVYALLLNAVVLGIVFARISRPGQRGRTIFLSDSAVVARRDGDLKFMFRIADIRPRYQVVNPRMHAHLYTWGAGHATAEGERIPVKVEQLDIAYGEGMMLLPITVEHTIDERSPLWGHSHDSLLALGAEIVVVFEGTSEFGHQFSTRQSYLPREIHWGYQFVQIVRPADPGSTQHIVDISRFHEIEPQSSVMELLRPSQLSRKVLSPPRGCVPASDLASNTLALSDQLCVYRAGGALRLAARVGDTRPMQMLDVRVRLYLYRWSRPGASRANLLDAGEPFQMQELAVAGGDRLCLRLPTLVSHIIDEDSPLEHWADASGILLDADSEIVVVAEAVTYAGQHQAMRQRTYSVLSDIKTAHRFAPMVVPPAETHDGHPGITWDAFHKLLPVPDEEAPAPSPGGPSARQRSQPLPRGGVGSSSGGGGNVSVAAAGQPRRHAPRPGTASALQRHATAPHPQGPPMQRAASAANLGPRPGSQSAVAASSQSFTAGGNGSQQQQRRHYGEGVGQQPRPGTALKSLAGDPLEWHRSGRGSGRQGGRRQHEGTLAESDGNGDGNPRDGTHRGHKYDAVRTARGAAADTAEPPLSSSSSRSKRSGRQPSSVEGTLDSTTLSDVDTWHTSRALRNVYFPPMPTEPPPQPPPPQQQEQQEEEEQQSDAQQPEAQQQSEQQQEGQQRQQRQEQS